MRINEALRFQNTNPFSSICVHLSHLRLIILWSFGYAEGIGRDRPIGFLTIPA